ncbi:MAG: ATP-dependent RecD-like DNA helicase [Actinobacteria bacterium]|nr:ATP-dependent RecD-like DNA helicase [Actinomycetota bacterium]
MSSDQLSFGKFNTPGPGTSAGQGRGAANKKTSTLEGILEHFVYSNEDNGWSVVRVRARGHRDLVTAVGNLLGVQPGESIRFNGYWVNDRKYGEQFKVESYTTIKPATLIGIEKYLGSGMIKGIGPVMASRLVGCFGLDTLEVIENQPERLTEVEGIGKVRVERICNAWQEQKEIKEVMVFLQSHGVTTTYAIKIYKQYGNRAISLVSDNPYRLAVDIFGIGFKTADKIAGNMGISPTSPQRAQAGILHVLSALSDEGHICYQRHLLVERTAKVLDIDEKIIDDAVDSLVEQGLVMAEAVTSDVPSSMTSELIYLRSLHASEMGIVKHIERLLSSNIKPVEIDIEKAINWFETRSGIVLANQQKDAISCSMQSKVMVVTGGPGTGKTTLIDGIIQILKRKGRSVLLAAPTGRAAKRLSEATGMEAKTIHRLLEFSPRLMAFERNLDNLLEADILILDEVSMVDIVLFYNVLKALPSTCQLILVGDVDQLPSVGPGSVLKDIIASNRLDVIRLTEVFRQAQESMVIMNAHLINSGKMPYMKNERAQNDFFIIEKENPEGILETIKLLIARHIPRRFKFNAVDDIQVLTPMHMGLLGASNLNKELQELLNPSREALTRGNRDFRIGDKVMQIRNNYGLDVYNGDIGKVAAIDPVEREIRVSFDGRDVTYEYSDLDELILAYACSVHKSQGSEYPAVIIPLHTQHYMMLQRNLLYTAVTRGKRLVIIVGSKRALAIAVKNNRIQERHTRLAERLACLT